MSDVYDMPTFDQVDEMSDDLKPCPFCGVVPLPVNTIGSYVFCGECGADGPVHLTEAIAAWNTRADKDRIEELEGQCVVYAEWDKARVDYINDLEAKLAKAVEALRFYIEYEDLGRKAYDTLEELGEDIG
jgi:Lar family restriction alleviation protein